MAVLFRFRSSKVNGMISLVLTVLALAQTPVATPAFSTWDGKSWAGLTVGLSENDLGKLAPKSKTVGPDPASVRIATSRKNWILAAILMKTNNKGTVAGFTVELERNEPLESLELLESELGKADYSVFPAVRYGEWSLSVWATKGVVAAVQYSGRPVVQKVLLAPPDVLAKTLDLWSRSQTQIQDSPRLRVGGFDINATTDPKNRDLEDEIERYIRRRTRRLMENGGENSWESVRGDGARIQVSFRIKRGKQTMLDGSVATSYLGPLGNFSINQSDMEKVDRDVRDRVEPMFDRLMGKLERELSSKLGRLAWQLEWRQFTSLCRPN